MQKILKIARLELSILFYSPIAWLVLVIFMVQTGITFTDILFTQETYQQLERNISVLSKVLFAGDKGTFKAVMDNLYLYIPLLTMSLFSREFSSGSIKLLLSSPVTVFQIVFGKFLTMMIYGLILSSMLILYGCVAYFSIAGLDIFFVLGGIFGLYLLICAYVSIGLFMSSLTSYQIVAAISTLAILASLNFMGTVGQEYDWLRDLTYWLSMGRRTENMINGLITSKDVIYFLLVICLFLTLTVMKLNAGRESRSIPVRIIRYSFLIALVIGLGVITSLPALTAYVDTSRFNDRTLSEAGQKMIARLNHPVSITTYTNILDYNAKFGAPKNRIADMGAFEKYERFIPSLKMDYVSYYDTTMYWRKDNNLKEEAKKAADAMDFDFEGLLKPEQIRQKINLVSENNRLVRFIEYNGKKTPLRMFDDIFLYPGEKEVLAAFKRLLDGPSKVGMMMGNGERSIEKPSDNSYMYFTKGTFIRGALINQGFEVMDINLTENTTIPDSLAVLIIADPEQPYSALQLSKINKYLDNGGNLLIAGEPGKQEMLNPILAKFNVSMMKGTILEQSADYEPDLIQAKFAPSAKVNGFSFRDDAVVALSSVSALSYQSKGGYKINILLESSIVSWNKVDSFDLKNEKVKFDSLIDVKSAYPLALSVTKEFKHKQQKIIVLGDADYMSNAELTRNNINTVNGALVIRMFKWFSDGEYPVSISRPDPIDNEIFVSRSQINLEKLLLLGLIPFLLAISGIFVLLKRRRN